jgi:hypothetical protein
MIINLVSSQRIGAMEKARSWYVESKSFEMMIKGGNYGLRMVEKGKKKQGSIFIHRDEIDWLVGAVEVVLDVDTSEVFWDPSSAGFPQVLVQRRSNRHGSFIFIEEYEGRNRRGSALIPEGRYGQGWSRLISELRIARLALWKGREFKARKDSRVVSGRSFAEVVGWPQSLENALKVVPAALASENEGGCAQSRPQIAPAEIDVQIGASKASVEVGGNIGVAPMRITGQAKEKNPVGSGFSASVLPETLHDPMKSGMAAPNVVRESERSGHAFVQGGLNLQEFTKYLMDIRGQLVLGLRRVEKAFHMLEMCMGRVGNAGVMGFGGNNTRNKEKMGNKRRNEGVGWSKPKKKIFRGKLTQPGLLGPKPNKESSHTFQGPGPMNTFHYRAITRCPAQQLRQAGESSATGAARTTGDKGMTIADDISGVHSPLAPESRAQLLW